MQGSSRAESGRHALVRLLRKLDLIDDAALSEGLKECLRADSLPISHFAGLGEFEEADAIELIAQKLKVPRFNLEKQQVAISLALLDDELLEKVQLRTWQVLRAIPAKRIGQSLVVAFANPLDDEGKRSLEFTLGCSILLGIASEAQITAALAKRAASQNERDLGNLLEGNSSTSEILDAAKLDADESNISSGAVDAAPVVKIVNKIFLDAVECRASDLHISPERDHLIVKARIDGVLRELFKVPKHLTPAVTSRIKLLAGMDISERRKPQDGRLRIRSGVQYRDLRMSTVPTSFGENIVARILSPDITYLTLDSLGMPHEIRISYERALSGSSRILLVTGPTGSGKTSTLYASVLLLRDGTTNIITIEDPIEYRLEGINQIQVNSKIGLTFADGLRSILRQDPDIVVVGEIRDGETASIAMQVAQTGHLVLSTLHTNSAAAAVTRLLDLGIPSYLLASSLHGVLAQRLVRRLCMKCSVPESSENSTIQRLKLDPAQIRRAVGCDACGGSGYDGRVGVYSFLEIQDQMRTLIRDQAPEHTLEAAGSTAGFVSLNDAGLRLALEGITSLDELEHAIGPFSAATVTHAPARPSAQDATQLTPHEKLQGTQRQRVLVVEDDENMRTVLSMIFERAMYDVVQAENGKQALEKIFAHPPHIIVCDLMMPTMDGAETVEILRSNPTTRRIPVLMLTAADSEENELRVLKSGADDFVSKTSDQKVILARVKRLLDRSV